MPVIKTNSGYASTGGLMPLCLRRCTKLGALVSCENSLGEGRIVGIVLLAKGRIRVTGSGTFPYDLSASFQSYKCDKLSIYNSRADSKILDNRFKSVCRSFDVVRW